MAKSTSSDERIFKPRLSKKTAIRTGRGLFFPKEIFCGAKAGNDEANNSAQFKRADWQRYQESGVANHLN